MYEKILQKLMEQRGTTSIVSDRTLEALAKSLSTVITTDELLTASDLTEAIKSMAGNINAYTADAVKTALSKKAEPAPVELPSGAGAVPDAKPAEEKVPSWAESLVKRLDALDNQKVKETRLSKVQEILNGMPDFYKKTAQSGFNRMTFENDETFETYLTEVKTTADTFAQAVRESGLNKLIPDKNVKPPVETGETSELSEARALVKKQAGQNKQN